MGKASRDKGKRGEREWAEFLQSKGHIAKRGVQYRGGADSPDVICATMPGFHPEVKRVECLKVYESINQAIEDAGSGLTPYVAHRRSNRDWLVLMRAEDFLTLVRKSQTIDVQQETADQASVFPLHHD